MDPETHIPSLLKKEPENFQQLSETEKDPKRFSLNRLNMNNNSLPSLNFVKYREVSKENHGRLVAGNRKM